MFKSNSGRRNALNENDYAEKVQQLRAGLYRTARLYLDSESAALDAVDEAVYKGLLACKRLREPQFFRTWLTRILINECHNELRRRKRSLSMAELPENAAEQFDALPLRDAVLRLTRELREPVILRYFSGLTTAETARTLGIPQGTAATRLRRALGILKLELAEEGATDEP